MGLFDQLSNLNPQQTQGLLAAAAQILQQSGPSRTPTSFGQVLGGGLSAYQQGSDTYRQRQLQEEQAAQAAQLRDLQIQDSRNSLQAAARKREQDEQIAAAARNAYTTPGMAALAGGGGPTLENAAKIPSAAGGFDQDAFINQVMQIDPIQGLALRQQYAKQAPKVKDWKEVNVDGKTLYAPLFENGTAGQPIPYEVAVKLERSNSGAYTDFTNPYSGQIVSRIKNTQSPDSVASNGLGWANYGLSKERLALDKETAQARAAAEKAPTEFQGKSAAYGLRAREADKILTDLTGKFSPAAINSKTSVADWPLIGGALGAATNYALSPEDQRAEQAQRDFVNAVLRQESGAAISPSEFNNARKQYFPQPGDDQSTIEQKARNRQLAIQGFESNAGRAKLSAPAVGGSWSITRVGQ